MTTKKKAKKRVGRPAKAVKRVDIGLHLAPDSIDLVTRAAALIANRRGIPYSRAMFCCESVVSAARKVLADAASDDAIS